MALQGLSKHCGINRPGPATIRYAPIAWIDAAAYVHAVTSANNWQIAIPFLGVYDWLTMPAFESGKGVGEQPGRTDQGKVYTPEVNGILRNMKPTVTGELEEMEEHRFLVRVTDANGNEWLLGTLDAPLDFQAEATDGEDNGLNSYRFRFGAQVPHRMAGYSPL